MHLLYCCVFTKSLAGSAIFSSTNRNIMQKTRCVNSRFRMVKQLYHYIHYVHWPSKRLIYLTNLKAIRPPKQGSKETKILLTILANVWPPVCRVSEQTWQRLKQREKLKTIIAQCLAHDWGFLNTLFCSKIVLQDCYLDDLIWQGKNMSVL